MSGWDVAGTILTGGIYQGAKAAQRAYKAKTAQENAMEDAYRTAKGLYGQAEAAKPPSLEQLQALLSQYYQSAYGGLGSAQERSLGLAGRQGGAYAASRGLNPYAYIQQSQAPVYDRYTGQFGELATNQLGQLANLPTKQYAMQGQYYNQLAQILSAMTGSASGMQNKSDFDYYMKILEMNSKMAPEVLKMMGI